MEPGDNVIDLAKERRRRGPRFNGGLMDILEVSRDLVCLCRAGAITAINGAGARMLGAATTEELVGRRMAEFLVPEYGRMLEVFLSGMASEDKSVPTRIMALDKSVKAVEMQTFRAREIAPDATVVVCRELVAEDEAAQQLHEHDICFRLFADNAANPVLRVRGGLVRYANRAAVALLGAPGPEALLGKALGTLTDENSASMLEDEALRVLAETNTPLPLTLRGLDGNEAGVLARLTLVPSPHGLDAMIEAIPVP